MPGRFPHEHLIVYRKALSLYEVAGALVVPVQRPHWHLQDQLLRAITSIVLNIAEGAAELSIGDKNRFLRMALRSTAESAAAVDILTSSHLVDPKRAGDLIARLREVAAMLTSILNRKRSPSH